jgi:hypothetical protein
MQLSALSIDRKNRRKRGDSMIKILALRKNSSGVSFLANLCCISAALLFLQCASNNIAGTGSHAGNGRIVCTLYNSDGSFASEAAVYLRPSNYTPSLSGSALRKSTITRVDTRTDSLGIFSIDSLEPGAYSIEVNDGSRNAVLLNCTINAEDSTVYLPSDTLRPSGAIKGSLASSDRNVFIQIYGLERTVTCDTATGEFVIDDLPHGTYTLRAVSSADTSSSVGIDSITVKSGETTKAGTIDFYHLASFNYSRRIYLNTTESGAGVDSDITDFPVLIRLHGDNFDFSQSRLDGGDLRFVKENGKPLPYEIEKWDAKGRKAEIWVKVDTVYGNDNLQVIIMYWGNPDAESESDGCAVFDTAYAFQGVWHLSGKGTDPALDATPNHYHGLPVGTSEESRVDGAIGGARSFDGTSSYITMPNTADSRLNFSEDGFYSISCWVKADTIDSIFRAIASKGHEQYYLQFKCLKNNRATWEFVEFQNQLGWEYSEDSVPPAPGAKEWVYLTGVRNGTNQSLYINGRLVVDKAALMPGEYERNSTDNFTIGSHGRSVEIPFIQGWSIFNGLIDEVRVSSIAHSEDWVKLCFMNQKADDALVEFRK